MRDDCEREKETGLQVIFRETQSYFTPFIVFQLGFSGVSVAAGYLAWLKDAFMQALLLDVSFVWLLLIMAMLSLRMKIKADERGIVIRTGMFALRRRWISWEDIIMLEYLDLREKDIPRLSCSRNHYILKGQVMIWFTLVNDEQIMLSVVDAFGFYCAARYFYPPGS